MATWVAGIEQHVGPLTANMTYVGTAGVHLPRINYPNAYPGAEPAFAPHTEFDEAGNVIGGFGTESVIQATAHSSYNALQTGLQAPSPTAAQPFQPATPGRSPSTTQVPSSAASSPAAQVLPRIRRLKILMTYPPKKDHRPLMWRTLSLSILRRISPSIRWTSFGPSAARSTVDGRLLSITSASSGSPFTIYSGVQQTGVGANGVDRPDLIEMPKLSTSREARQDYFGRGADNGSFFSIPINVAGGTGPNHGVFGTMGRNTFRGPYSSTSISPHQEHALRHRGGGEMFNAQFRAEFFNLFNIVNFGLPSNTIKGSGFGQISRTAGTSRQIQFSLKLQF